MDIEGQASCRTVLIFRKRVVFMMNIKIIAFIALAYLIGSIPFGLLIARARGVDLRAVGSGNIGATNVFRAVGKGFGFLTFALDALKGFYPAWFFTGFATFGLAHDLESLLFGFAAIAGHNWPVFLRFKGGKGVATSAGVIFAVAPMAAFAGLASFAICLKLSRIVSVSSMAAALVIASLSWMLYLDQGLTLPVALSCLAMVVIIRHRSNIQRLLAGTETVITTKGED